MFGVRRALLASAAVVSGGGGGGPSGPIGTPVAQGLVYKDGTADSTTAPVYTNTVAIYQQDIIYFLPIGLGFSSTPTVTDNQGNEWEPSQTNAYGSNHVTPYYTFAPGDDPTAVAYEIGELEITADFGDAYEYILIGMSCSGILVDPFNVLDGPALNSDFFPGTQTPSLSSGAFSVGPLQDLAVGLIVYTTGPSSHTEADGWVSLGTENMGGGGSNITFGLAWRIYDNSDGEAVYNPTFVSNHSPILCLDVLKGAAT